MKEIFDIKRFCRFFRYDLRNNWNNYWLSLLICSAMPLIVFAFVQMMGRLFTGDWVYDGQITQVLSIITAMTVVVFTYPVKVYGFVTDRRAGSNWLLLPASPEEKTLSMLLSSGVALPAVFFALLIGFDALVGAIFPKMWPEPLVCNIWNWNDMIATESEGIVKMNLPGLLYYSWAINIFTFVLGSIFFKKAKIGKTFLVIFLVGQAFSILSSILMIGTPAFGDLLRGNVNSFDDPSFALGMVSACNWIVNIYCWLYFIIVVGLIWLRVKTMKH